jgi:hypothetical protein
VSDDKVQFLGFVLGVSYFRAPKMADQVYMQSTIYGF